MPSLYFQTPLGWFVCTQSGEALTYAAFCSAAQRSEETPLLKEARAQLCAYFEGRLRTFSLPLHATGTPFQQAVWTEMDTVPYGQTRTYGALARACGHPHAYCAVGQACHVNPLGIVRPCHRIVAAHGALGGYAAGAAYKQALLQLEAAHCALR